MRTWRIGKFAVEEVDLALGGAGTLWDRPVEGRAYHCRLQKGQIELLIDRARSEEEVGRSAGDVDGLDDLSRE